MSLFVELTVTAVVAFVAGWVAHRRDHWFQAWDEGRRYERAGRRRAGEGQ